MPALEQFKTGDLPPTVRQDINLSPEVKKIYDQQIQQDTATNNIAQGYLGRINSTLGQNFNTSGLPALKSGVTPGQLQSGVDSNGLPDLAGNVDRGQVQGQLDYSGTPALQSGVQGSPLQMSAGGIPNLNTRVAPTGRVQRGVQNNQQLMGFGGDNSIQQNLDYGSLPGLPGTEDFSADAQRVANAQYGKQTAFLDPQYQKSQNQQEAQLANQGIYLGSEAYKNAQDEMGRQKSFDYGQARDSAILAGGNEQSRLFGLGLSARQQAQNEATTQGQFTNLAQNQEYNQALGRGTFANQALGQNFQQGLQAGQFGNQAQQQTYNQNLGTAQFSNQALMDQYAQQLAGGQFANQAAGQQFGQNLQAGNFQNQARAQATGETAQQGQFANQAQNQDFAQNLSAADLQNQARQQGYAELLSGANLQNQSQAQQFQQGQQNATLADQARQQGLQEQAFLRQLPLNEYNALRSSSQVQMPQFQGVNGAQVANTNVAGNIQNAYQAQLSNYNQQVASQNSTMGNLFGLGGSLGAALITHSDVRTKREIIKIGETPSGLGVYEFKYLWSDKLETGVMAQEVEILIPEAVITTSSGFKMVNYGMVR